MISGFKFSSSLVLCAMLLPAQTAAVRPLRTPPSEKLTVNLGFRDWGAATISGTTLLAGNQTGRGGVFAVDTVTGKARWSFRPVLPGGTASVSMRPAVAGNLVITAFSTANPGAVIAVSLATGKEVWRGPNPEQDAGIAVSGNLAYVLSKDGNFYALDTATGQKRWSTPFLTDLARCASEPVVREGVVYFTAIAKYDVPGAARPYSYYLFALDAQTGKELWRYRAEAPYVHTGVCLSQPVVTADAIYATGDNYLYGVVRVTGQNLWPPVEVRRPVEGRERGISVSPLVDAGPVLVGISAGYLLAFSKDTGRAAWEIPGTYRDNFPATAVAGNVLYFQGSPSIKPAASASGTLHALDLDTRQLLWSFTRPTVEPNWSFGRPVPVDSGLWVASYQTFLKLE
ncbi:MAG: PQQ-binding-like beta-propeller repeat protein [Candidatus Solibacter sp.]